MRVLRRASSPTERSGGLIRDDWLTSAPKQCRSYFGQLQQTIVRPRHFFPRECAVDPVRGIFQKVVRVCLSRNPTRQMLAEARPVVDISVEDFCGGFPDSGSSSQVEYL